MLKKIFAVSFLALLSFFAKETLAAEKEIILNEVGFKGSADFIELKVLAEGNYAGYEIYKGAVKAAALPDFGTLAPGEIILLHEEGGVNDSRKEDNNPDCYDLYDLGSLQSTDNIIQIKKPDHSPFEVLIYANNSGSFTGNITEANLALEKNLWAGQTLFSKTSDVGAWIDTDELPLDFSLQRLLVNPVNSPADFSAAAVSPGFEIESNLPPEAAAGEDKETTVGSEVIFDASGSGDPEGDILTYEWDFGDGAKALGRLTRKTFTEAREYLVTLKVVDEHGLAASDNVKVVVKSLTYSHQIKISEVYPNPSGEETEEEFIELVNSGAAAVDLAGYQVADLAKTYRLEIEDFNDLKLQPGSFLLLPRVITGIALNNTGETATLRDPNGELIDQISYPVTFEGQSFAVIDNNLIWTKEVTPGAANILKVDSTPVPEPQIVPTQPVSSLPLPPYSNQVQISEILPNPAGDENTVEWIELVNKGDTALDLSFWQVDDAEGGSLAYLLPVGTKIEAHSWLVFWNKETKISLNNTADEARLLYPDGQVANFLSYENAPEEQSLARNLNGAAAWTKTLTPGKENIFNIAAAISSANTPATNVNTNSTTSSVSDSSAKKIIISEIYPNPLLPGQTEWIELYNPTRNDLKIENFKLDDQTGGSKPYIFPKGTLLRARSYLLLKQPMTKLVLNNTADEVRLLDPKGVVITKISFGKTVRGLSYAWNGKNWSWTTTLTPGKTNIIKAAVSGSKVKKKKTAAVKKTKAKSTAKKTSTAKTVPSFENINLISFNAALELEKGAMVHLKGIVSVAPGMLSKRFFYFQDETNGLQVYRSKGDFSDLKIGDVVELVGKTSLAEGEKRILVDAKSPFKKVGSEQELKVEILSTGEVLPSLAGKIIKIKGILLKKEGNIFYFDDGSGVLKVYLSKGSLLKAKDFTEKNEFEITGLARFKDEEIILTPRQKEDVKEITRVGNPELKAEALGAMNNLPFQSRNAWLVVGVASLLLAIYALIKYFLKRKELKK